MREFAPDVLAAAESALASAVRNAPFVHLDSLAWERTFNISIDYAIMEKVENITVMPFDGQWSDLGGWDSMLRATATGSDNVSQKGQVTAIDCIDSLLHAEDGSMALVGLGLRNIARSNFSE
jgi:mannose-1-phosphate guanylyltransferase/mannose-6-phosphate isomerase